MVGVSCILINYNTSHYTIDCIKSIIANTISVSFEIVVVDNASEEEDFRKLEAFINSANFSNLKLIRSRINVGFGAGNMLGVQNASNCNYYAFINNDTLQVTKDCLGGLFRFMESNQSVGICSPQMLDEYGQFRVTIDHFSSLPREIFKRALLEKVNPSKYLNRKIRYHQPTKVHYVQGSFMFTRAKDFNEIGGFDTNLFLYYEESDLSLRMLKERQKYTYLIPSLEYIHYKGGSTGKSLAIKIEQKISLLYHTRKHYGWFFYKFLLVYFCVRYTLRVLIKPSYWSLLKILFIGAPLTASLKLKQSVI